DAFWSVDVAQKEEGIRSLYVTGVQASASLIWAPDRLANANGWYKADVTVSFTAGDEPGGSGLATVPGPTTLGEGAGQSVTGTAKIGRASCRDRVWISVDVV